MSFRQFVEQELGEFPHFFIYAVLEWALIFLLFVDGFLAFVSSEFAKFFDLKTPCLLCTRIDHVLVRRTPDSHHNDSICESHKKTISSLAYCHFHKKLSDIRSMCEGCLLSYATEREYSNHETYKSLVGTLHKDADFFIEDDKKGALKSGKKENGDGSMVPNGDVNRCSCCGELMKNRGSSSSTSSSSLKKNYVRSGSINAGLRSQGPAPSPRASWRSVNEDGRSLELPHIRYTELKFMMDNEAMPEDEIGFNIDSKQSREDLKSVTAPLLPVTEEISEESLKTPTFIRGNRFFGIPLSDSASASPRWANRRKPDPNDPTIFPSSETDVPDGDNIMHHLKRQVRLDRKSLMALYMELDEERSASAVAANNAMAMITRLQAEKAAVQMEALQYQRMMEEQAEYDQEAFQVLKDLLDKKEEEVKALEVELEGYREKYGEVKKEGSEDCEANAKQYQELKSQLFSLYEEKSDCESPGEVDQAGESEASGKRFGENRRRNPEESSFDFESETSYLFGMLKNLEKKINLSADEEVPETENRGDDHKATLTREVSLIKERLRAIEADSGFLQHTAMTLQKGGEGTKLLTEIAQQLRKIRQPKKPKSIDGPEFSLI